MSKFLHGAALVGLLGGGLSAGDALGQTKDLQVEQIPSHPYAHRHPLRPSVASYSGPVQVSMIPVGASTLPIGEPIRFRMVSLAEGYRHLYVLSASGRVQLWLENVRVHAGVPISFPRGGQIVRAAPPAGDETLLFVATRARVTGILGGGTVTQTPIDLQYAQDAFRSALQVQLDSLPRNDWAIAELHIRVTE